MFEFNFDKFIDDIVKREKVHEQSCKEKAHSDTIDKKRDRQKKYQEHPLSRVKYTK